MEEKRPQDETKIKANGSRPWHENVEFGTRSHFRDYIEGDIQFGRDPSRWLDILVRYPDSPAEQSA